ncbi:redoxin domain-containing protein [Lentzea tibetensis]|uniref:Redoxin domain-containing protein n=1 Tax=Lentzea tibetensis TaxID=2591470 RepID=A0A563F4I5_9PSEU|nr:redoxin domain-containing protein [Lentzea tibetensis]
MTQHRPAHREQSARSSWRVGIDTGYLNPVRAGRVVHDVRVLLILLSVLLVGCGSAAPAADQLKFDAKTLTGEDFSGASLAGKPVALWFWAPWCPSCRAEAETVAAVARDHTDVTFVGVASRDKIEPMKQFVAERGMDGFSHIADLDGAVWKRFGVTAQPAFAFISAKGKVDVIIGAPLADDLDRRLDALAKGEPQPGLG